MSSAPRGVVPVCRRAKSLTFATGQAPVKKYHRELMQAILNDRVHIADAQKFILDTHGLLDAA